MENSNTLPVIEIGDTVIFRTDLEVGKRYGTAFFLANMRLKRGIVLSVADDGLFHISHENNYWYSPEMVAQVIKPTKERVYTEQEMKESIRKAKSGLIDEIIKMYVPDGNPESFLNKIKSLNK